MKKIFFLLIVFVSIGSYAQNNPARFKNGINLPNATQQDTLRRIPVMSEDGTISGYVFKASIAGGGSGGVTDASQLTGQLNDAQVQESNVTQHEAALTILESQISGLNYTVDTDNQQISISGNVLTLERGGNTIDLTPYLDNINNYVDGITVTGTGTKTITLTREGLPDLTASFTDLSSGGGTSDGNDFLTAVTESGGVLTFEVTGQTNPTFDLDAYLATKNYSTGAHTVDTKLSDAEVATAVNNEFPNLDADGTDDFDGDYNSLANLPIITDDQTASEVSYDNTTSGAVATDLQNVVDELFAGAANPVINVRAVTGGADFTDTQYTTASPFAVTVADGSVNLPNNAGLINIDKTPSVLTNGFYFNGKIQGYNGSFFSTTIEFKVRPTSAASNIRIKTAIDIGGTVGEIYPRNFVLTKGNGAEHFYSASFLYYTKGTFQANGGTVKVLTENGPVEIYDVRYVFAVVHYEGNNTDAMTLDQYGAILNANSASAANPFATVGDILNYNAVNADIVLFGDSITEDDPGWVNIFDTYVNPASITNMAVGGQQVTWNQNTVESTTVTNGSDDNRLWNSIKKWEQDFPGASPDAIIIAIGTNDRSNDLGSYADAYSQDEPSTAHTTLAGATRKALDYLRTNYPNARVYWSLPIQSAQPDRDYVAMINVGNVIRSICNRLGVFVFEATTESGIVDALENESANGVHLSDGLHPNAQGREVLGKYIAVQFLSNYPK